MPSVFPAGVCLIKNLMSEKIYLLIEYIAIDFSFYSNFKAYDFEDPANETASNYRRVSSKKLQWQKSNQIH